MSAKFYEEIIDNYKKLYETKEGYDVKIYAGEKPNIKEFHVHSFILKTQSEFYKKAFIAKDGIEKKDGHFILNSSHSPKVLEILLSYMYYGSIDLTKSQPHEFGLQPLWACGQQPVIQQDISKWSKNDFTVMERRLSRFIPLIRFYCISSEDFLLKIYPFKELLSNDLVNNILAHHMAPNNKLNINIQPPRSPRCSDSTIIKCQHLSIFASWIDKKETLHYNNKCGHIPYRFNLLYRASRDGNTAAAFHEKCDNKEATIIVAKVTNSEQIVGGYNPLSWDSSNSWKSTNDSFIFSFKDRTDLRSAKVSYSNNDQYSIYCSFYGPQFGYRGNLVCQNGLWYSTYYDYNYAYPKIDIPENNFNVIDYEVFQVIRI
ncbi:hypothetical protein C1645_828509 [Glomus cerebriforme]|uniref:BTB/POZ domain-containing protein n=1 Tax=Glomus cerebriforme TaxID=658196 RepID=A0A397SMP3_9GLOM|nr:hypothetical protein C1645_828509 [Glomus cerebriforme]